MQKTKKQALIPVPLCLLQGMSLYARFITRVSGTGQLQSAELDLKNEVITLEIVHDPSSEGLPPSQMSRIFDPTFDKTFN